MLKAVIFDMDGVIIDSEPLHLKATMETLKDFNVFPSNEFLEQFVGSTAEAMYDAIITEYNLSVPAEELIRIDEDKCKALYEKEGMTPVPGVLELIKALYKAGVKMAIASSSPIKRIEAVTKEFNISKYFQKFVSGSQVQNPKPAPDIFLKALKELGVKAGETIVIEDSSNGCQAAKAALIPCIGYMNPHSGNQDLYAATVAVESLGNLEVSYINQVLLRANGLPLTICTTKNLIIRELTVEDIKKIYAIYQNKHVREFIDDIDEYLEIEMEKHEAYIKNVYSFYGFGLWGVFSKTTKELIGRCGIQNQVIDGKQEIEISYMLDEQHWGSGYALECCKAVIAYAHDELSIPRIVAVMDKLNIRSVRLAEKLNMHLEKEIRYHDRNCFLYTIDLTSERYLSARDAAVTHYEKADVVSNYHKYYSK